jgi:aconitate hydratase
VWLPRLTGRTVAPGLDVSVVPGTSHWAAALAAGGEREVLLGAGIAVLDPFAVAESARGSGGTRLGAGRSAPEARGSEWWLANPEVCAASALSGALADPRDAALARARSPRQARGGDARPVPPATLQVEQAGPVVTRYAGVMSPPEGALRVVVWVVVGDDWPAERIVSRSARARREVLDDPVAGLFPGQDRQWTEQTGPEARGVIVAGRDFGSGDVADEAAWALRRAGVAAVIARSFAPEFARALGHAGVLALQAGQRPLHEIAGWGEELEIPSLPEAVEPGHPVGVRNLTRGVQDTLHHGLDAEAIAVWRAGGLLARAGVPAA